MYEGSPPNAAQRLQLLVEHLSPHSSSSTSERRTLSPSETLIVRTNSEIKWNGHGYRDTYFEFDDKGTASLTGFRYSKYSSKEFHDLRPWLEQTLRINLKTTLPSQPTMPSIHSPVVNHEFYDMIKPYGIQISFSEQDRLCHGHGRSTSDIYRLRYSNIVPLPDAVIWPESHEQVETIVCASQNYNVGLIPYGGGSNDVNALECPIEDDRRMIVVLDMRQMNRMLGLSKENMFVTVEAGAVAKDLEKELRKDGFTLGWEAESVEFSTLGSLAARRSSGIKKKFYDFTKSIIEIQIVTPAGTVQHAFTTPPPPTTAGPSLLHIFLGSEGTLGVITSLTLKIYRLTPHRRVISLYFPTFQTGLFFLREITQKNIVKLVGARMVDEVGLDLVQAFNTQSPNLTSIFKEVIKRYYWKKVKNLVRGKMCLAAIIVESEDVGKLQVYEQRVIGVAEKFGGVDGGWEIGDRVFSMSQTLPYLRDFLMDYYVISDSLDTTISWSHVQELSENVKNTIKATCRAQSAKASPWVAVRVDTVYDTGVSLTFMYGFNFWNLPDPLGALLRVEQAAMVEILKLRGSVSHHTTGIGKRKKEMFIESSSETSLAVLKSIK
ncbi:9358_t:CDS:2, partial [Paraglomus occultum]